MTIQQARKLRNSMSDAERRLWSRLRRRRVNGRKFRRQFPLGRYVVDLVCLEARLAIEVDGGQHAEQITHDEERDAWIKSQDFHVLRSWDNEVMQQTDAVVEEIARALLRVAPPPVKGEGE